jgi:protein tyrosine/serine phosphatase
MATKLSFKRLAKRIGILAALALLALGAYGLYLLATDNLHPVIAGQIYRSGQMNGEHLARIIQEYGIKSVLNLRGENPTTRWHQAEMATTAKLNVTHYDRSLGSGTPLTLEQMDDLVTLLREAPKPVLVHCNGGADRSALVSALYCFAIADEPADKADRQLTIWYGHIPLIRPKVIAMDNSFRCYVTNHEQQIQSPAKPAQ